MLSDLPKIIQEVNGSDCVRPRQPCPFLASSIGLVVFGCDFAGTSSVGSPPSNLSLSVPQASGWASLCDWWWFPLSSAQQRWASTVQPPRTVTSTSPSLGPKASPSTLSCSVLIDRSTVPLSCRYTWVSYTHRQRRIHRILCCPCTAVQLSQHLGALELDASVMNSGIFYASKPVRHISLSEWGLSH